MNISSRFSGNTEADASEFRDNLEELLLRNALFSNVQPPDSVPVPKG